MTNSDEQTGTLWRCQKCGSSICIYAARDVRTAMCPVCRTQTLKYRGSFESILGLLRNAPEPS